MMRFFLNPWMLVALVGVLVPILIELLFRRRRRQVELPTLRYLLGSRAEKKVKRQNRILLILRCMVPLVLAVALARPMLSPEGAAAVHGRHVVLVVDDTLSMGQQVGVSTAFAFARKKAAQLVRILPKGTRVSLITLGHRPEVKLDRSDDLYAAGEMIEAMKISHGAGALADALPLIRRTMTAAGADEKQEIYFFSDFQKTTWLRRSASSEDPPASRRVGTTAGKDPVRELRSLGALGEVFLIDVGLPRPAGGERPYNCFATALAPEEPLVVTGRDTRFHATVETRGTPPPGRPPLRLTFLVDGEKKSMREVTPVDGKASARFDYRFAKPGEYLIEVAAEGDSHRLDNRRFYLASVRESLPVLVLDDAAVGGRTSTEAAFLTAAIAPRERAGLDRTSIFSAKVIHPADIIREDLGTCVAVVLLATERVGSDLARELEPWVRDGGSVIFFLGSRANPWEYNERLYRGGGGILPVQLEKSQPADPDSSGLGIRVASTGHPAFAFFEGVDALAEAGIMRWTSLIDTPDAGVIATFTSGKPAIIEKTVGRGRVVTVCCAAGPPENLLAASVNYPVFLQEMLRYLVPTRSGDEAVNLVDGDAFAQEVMISAQHLVLRKPDRTKVRLTPVHTAPDRLGIVFDGTDRMGEYRIDAQPGVLRRTRFVVNLQPAEGDLDRLEREDALEMLPDAVWLNPAAPMESVVREKYNVRELAATILWVLAALLLVETLVAMRFGRRRR